MKYLVLIFLWALYLPSYSQTIIEITTSQDYIYGIGEDKIYEKADKQALNNLISKISITVHSELTFEQVEKNSKYEEFFNSVINTYSTATLKNAFSVEEEKNGLYKVVRYIKKGDFYTSFDERKKLLIEYVKEGLKQESKSQISDALRNLYWAYLLLYTHPDANHIKFEDNLLKVYLPQKIIEILSNLQAKITDYSFNENDQYEKYIVNITYKNKPIQNIDYSFKNQKAWTTNIGTNDGVVLLDFYGVTKPKSITPKIKIEYKYEEKANFDTDVKSIFDSEQLYKPEFNNILNISHEYVMDTFQLSQTLSNQVTSNVNKILENINKVSNNGLENLFTSKGLEVYNKLVNYGNPQLLYNDNNFKTVQINDKYYVRSVPMRFKFSNGTQFIEKVVFECNSDSKINNIVFSLSQIAIDDILKKEERFASKEEKYFLINFLENYKTAYCLKRLDYLENIFDDDALIIVGNVLSKYTSNDSPIKPVLTENEIRYQRYTKNEYLSNLKRVFNNNEYINIHFEDNSIRKIKKDINIYGIQISQHYVSKSYADKGYLFLMVDLRDTLKPIIHVRTWQPNKHGNTHLYNENDFPFSNL